MFKAEFKKETALEEGFFGSIGAVAKVTLAIGSLTKGFKKDLEKSKDDTKAVESIVTKYFDDVNTLIDKSSLSSSLKQTFKDGMIKGMKAEIEKMEAELNK